MDEHNFVYVKPVVTLVFDNYFDSYIYILKVTEIEENVVFCVYTLVLFSYLKNPSMLRSERVEAPRDCLQQERHTPQTLTIPRSALGSIDIV